jgi:hypothetical protein
MLSNVTVSFDDRGHLERWHEHENAATRQALQEWAAECGLRMVDQ